MDVHPPHGGIHSWRDFFVHLVVITLGLLIALGLEGIVEWGHNRHLVHTAEANLTAELQANRKTLADDLRFLDAAQRQTESDLSILAAVKQTNHASQELTFHWTWNGPASAAWDTARNTGAVALMNYESAEKYSDIYGQQAMVAAQSVVYVRDIYRTASPLEGGHKLGQLKPAELDAMIANAQQTLVDLKYLRDLSVSLARLYQKAPGGDS
ncbi:MAG TPA: hypothetical protein VJV96_15775 [Candidatus Angelobacter sp.]|jgi:hypothetical protein|nr:hypothetical protein [Candidatus Angelobacter sp.]